MKLYGFWRSLASYRVRAALKLKGLAYEEISINLLGGAQHAPAFRAVNPQGVVPALVVDDGPPLFQSLAIIEYLDELHPNPALLPADPRGRARVRGLAQIATRGGHPLIVPRVRGYLEKELGVDEAARNRWLAHWTLEALKSIEAHLANEPQTGRYCHGDSVTIADLCLASQMLGARFFNCDTTSIPVATRIFTELLRIEAFDAALPLKQPDAPAGGAH
jgi:maleylacetoacetate isomerase